MGSRRRAAEENDRFMMVIVGQLGPWQSSSLLLEIA